MVPLFLAALLLVRGVPALMYRRLAGIRRAEAAGLLQATTLTFVIVATQIGIATGKTTPTAAASLLAAGLLSAALFPGAALRLLSQRAKTVAVTPEQTSRLIAGLSPHGSEHPDLSIRRPEISTWPRRIGATGR